jgi:hypothetical protein
MMAVMVLVGRVDGEVEGQIAVFDANMKVTAGLDLCI